MTIRRLNRIEYNNTIRDLVGIDFRPADDFPSDDVGYGFDNIGDVLTIPPILMEKYLAAAESIAEHAIMAGASARGPIRKWEAERPGELNGGRPDGDSRSRRGSLDHSPGPAQRHLRRQSGSVWPASRREPARMALNIDGKTQKNFDVTAIDGAPGTYEISGPLKKGNHRIAVAFLNDYFNPDDPDPSRRDRNLAVQSIEVEGPLYAPGDPLPESHRRIIFRTPAKPTNTRTRHGGDGPVPHPRLSAAGHRRRGRQAAPAGRSGPRERRYLRAGNPARRAGRAGLAPVSLSRRAEQRPPQVRRQEERRRIEPSAQRLRDCLASLLLSLEQHARRRAQSPRRRRQAAHRREPDSAGSRMLRDPRAGALVENFAGQWLQLRNLKTVSPDKGLFPSFDEPLREAMQQESEEFFAAVMREDKSILDFLDCDYTYLNERLARHYGVAGVQGDSFRLVKLKGGRAEE